MTDQKHTKEPWKISDDSDYPEATIMTDQKLIADANIFGAGSSKKTNMTNAKRIVECVNACAGIENPQDLRKQRDELREAIEYAVDDLKNCDWSCHICGQQQGMDETDLFDVLTKALTKTKESV